MCINYVLLCETRGQLSSGMYKDSITKWIIMFKLILSKCQEFREEKQRNWTQIAAGGIIDCGG